MLDVWLIPAVVVMFLVLFGLYFVLKFKGGTGVRTEGRTLLHKPGEEHDLPPG